MEELLPYTSQQQEDITTNDTSTHKKQLSEDTLAAIISIITAYKIEKIALDNYQHKEIDTHTTSEMNLIQEWPPPPPITISFIR